MLVLRLPAEGPVNELTCKIIIGCGEKEWKLEQWRKCLNRKTQEKQPGRRAAGGSEKERIFVQIARWLSNVPLLCSRVEASQPLAWWVAGLGLFARLL